MDHINHCDSQTNVMLCSIVETVPTFVFLKIVVKLIRLNFTFCYYCQIPSQPLVYHPPVAINFKQIN